MLNTIIGKKLAMDAIQV